MIRLSSELLPSFDITLTTIDQWAKSLRTQGSLP